VLATRERGLNVEPVLIHNAGEKPVWCSPSEGRLRSSAPTSRTAKHRDVVGPVLAQ